VRDGFPQVYSGTSEQFVAQMLNLDLIGAVAFDKGCYTGQEVIARAHYRGRVKRRMQRWLNASGTPLLPGAAARARDGRALVVVRVADDGEGRQELLAVGNYGAVAELETPVSDAMVVVDPLPLPYSLPE
jgi:folate-binding protein YgfZ